MLNLAKSGPKTQTQDKLPAKRVRAALCCWLVFLTGGASEGYNEENPMEDQRADRLGLPFAGKVTFGIKGRERSTEVLTQDISATGAYFVANATPETGDPVAVNLYWQPEGEPDVTFKTVGTVTRVDHLPDNTWGFAVTFEDPEWQQLDQPPGQE